MDVAPRRVKLHESVPRGLPPSLQTLTAPCYVHRAAQWKVSALLSFALAVILTCVGYGLWRWRVRSPDAGEIAAGLFLLFFAVLLVRPSTWRAPVVAAADRQGIFFVGGRESVLVPWHEIGPLTVERVALNEGVGESVVVAIAVESSYWNAARRSAFGNLLMGSEQPPGFLRVPLSCQGIDPELTRASMDFLRDQHDARGRGGREAT